MAELTKEEALHTWSTLRELLETGDYDTLDPDEEYADEEEVEGELAACLLHLKKSVCMLYTRCIRKSGRHHYKDSYSRVSAKGGRGRI